MAGRPKTPREQLEESARTLAESPDWIRETPPAFTSRLERRRSLPRVGPDDPLWDDPAFVAWVRGIQEQNARDTEPIEIVGGESGRPGGDILIVGGKSG